MHNILIIEDEADLRTTLQEAFTEAGYQVKAVPTAELGLVSIVSSKPDLIILDVMTHSIHGAEFMERLHILPDGKGECKVIVLTALDNKITKDKMNAYPIAEFLVKSDTPISTLLDRVAHHLSAA